MSSEGFWREIIPFLIKGADGGKEPLSASCQESLLEGLQSSRDQENRSH